MLPKIVKFVQYNNFFTLAMMFIFMGASATFAASPQARASILDQKEVVRSVDNTYIVNTDFSAYEVGLKVLAVKEDTDWYYVDYTYNTAEVVDYVWKQVPKSGSMKVSKKELGNKDLGLYVAEQLGQVSEQQISYLKNVQKEEKKFGATQKIVATEYSGLVGQFLKTDEKTFDGYRPVKPPVEVASDSVIHGENNTVVGTSLGVTVGTTPAISRDEINNLIQDTIKQLLANANQPTATTTDIVSTTDTSATVSSSGSGSSPSSTTQTTVSTSTSTSTSTTTPTSTSTTSTSTITTTSTSTASTPVATSTPSTPVDSTPVATSTTSTTPEPTPVATTTPTPAPTTDPTPTPAPAPTPTIDPAPTTTTDPAPTPVI